MDLNYDLSHQPLTVGNLRELIAHLPADMPIVAKRDHNKNAWEQASSVELSRLWVGEDDPRATHIEVAPRVIHNGNPVKILPCLEIS